MEQALQNSINKTNMKTEGQHRRCQTLWSRLFEPDVCLNYLETLSEHVDTFYDEIYDEGYARLEKIQAAIAELHKEASELKRLLNVDFQLDPQEGVPLYTVQMKLDQDLEFLRDKLKERYEQIDEYLLDQEIMCEELGEEPRYLSKDPLPTEEELISFKIYLDELREEKLSRFDTISSLRRQIKLMLTQLETTMGTERENEILNATNFPPTRYNMMALKDMHENVSQQLADIKNNIEKMKGKLEVLWKYLQVSPAVIEKFSAYLDYTQTTHDKFFIELDRCETLKRENIQVFVENTRAEISLWWDKCLKSKDERARFSNFKSDVYNEDLLTLHEMELNDLQQFYSENETIFELIEQRRQMWDKLQSLEFKSNDADRYKNRGGKLLEEEKERKMVAIKLPKIEDKLLEQCQKYEAKRNRKFTIFGHNVVDVIAEEKQRREEAKILISSARKKANAMTPNARLATTRTPRTGGDATGISRTRIGNSMLKGSGVKPMLSATRLSGTKRKHSPPKSAMQMHAKRSLLSDLNSPAPTSSSSSARKGTFLKPKPVSSSTSKSRIPTKSPCKLPSKKIYEAGSLKKRRSSTKSRSLRKSTACPAIYVVDASSCDSSPHSETMNYDKFQDFLETNTPNRSSVMPAELRERAKAQSRTRKSPRAQPLVSKVLSSTALKLTTTPSPNNKTKKLTTKNLPIII